MLSSSFSLSRADLLVNVEDSYHIWPGLNWDSPSIVVPDVQKAIQFYEKVFGFQPVFILPDENNEISFARVRYRGTYFALIRKTDTMHDMPSMFCSENYSSTSFYLYVDHVERVYHNALEQGCRSIQAPHIDFLGDHKARLVDVFGYFWDIAAKL